ncbi:DNA-deoxyinosine glycosylase [Novosphingobium sp. Gsoil 351]|uniref:DNA-deoxyinosine glycosylase n=1 Tax=Novosphingobium sp. Gsoil 351 TaxID=2675225 RepID=UPI0012B461B7|nr:DNA-deoxyinosine glycosylase [Novosphingobium sp. Gsoil 351]QGN55403.1 DNA-deoxyinosine glycosylase [Novosphingobium sp. Gsoil 351]
MTQKCSFAPVVSPETRLLVLGSLPGEASLNAQRYYAHPRNQFWRLAGCVIGRQIARLDYEARLAALLDAKFGMWDTVASARREGSLDAALREVEGNALGDLVATLPSLRAIGFNGAAAARIGRKALGETRLALIDLPSSSPAHAAMNFAQKAERWKLLREYLG